MFQVANYFPTSGALESLGTGVNWIKICCRYCNSGRSTNIICLPYHVEIHFLIDAFHVVNVLGQFIFVYGS